MMPAREEMIMEIRRRQRAARIRQLLAARGGGDSSPSSAPPPNVSRETSETPSAAYRFASNLASTLDPRPLIEMARSPIESAKGLVQAQTGQFSKAGERFQQGRYSEALGHGMAGMLPLIGPAAAGIGEQIGSGDVAGGLGAVTGAALPLGAVKAAGKAAPALRKAAKKQYSQALRPTKEVFKRKTERVVPQLLERREAAKSRQALQAKAQQRAGEALDRLKELEDAIPEGTKAKVGPVLKALEKEIDRNIGARTKSGIIGNEAAVKQLTKVWEQFVELGDDVSYQTVKRIRQIFDKEVAEAGGFYGKTLKEGSQIKAKQEAANAIRREIAKEHPDIAKVNAEYSLWKNVDEIVGETIKRTEAQAPSLLGTITTSGGLAGGLAGGAATGGIGGAVAGGVMTAAMIRGITGMFNSPGWKMVSAVKKQQLADALASGKPARISKVASGIIAGNRTLQSMPFEMAPQLAGPPPQEPSLAQVMSRMPVLQ